MTFTEDKTLLSTVNGYKEKKYFALLEQLLNAS